MKKWISVLTVFSLLLALAVAAAETAAQGPLRLNYSGITIGVKQSVSTVKVISGHTVTWSSSDEKIATVTGEGKIKGVKKGKAVITAASGAETAEVEVTVVAKDKGVKKIKLNKKKVSLEQGKSVKLKATLTPKNPKDKNITWISSDESVATVNSKGKVKAVSKGTATITAIASSGKTAKCEVTVSGIKVNKIVLRCDPFMKVGETQVMNAEIRPNNAENQEIKWKSSNKKILTVDEYGIVTAHKKGWATITATAKDGSKTKASYDIVVKGKKDKNPMPKPDDDFAYVIENEKVIIKTYWGSEKDVVIPEKINGYPVVKLDCCSFASCDNLQSVTIPTTVEEIDTAFYFCKNLSSITFKEPSSLRILKNGAFTACPIIHITLPASLEIIDSGAFCGCEFLTSVTFAPNSKLSSMADSTFASCKSLPSITIPPLVENVGRLAFYDCPALSSITFASDNTLKTIGEGAFECCTSLASIDIPSSVTSVGKEAFASSALKSVHIPAPVTSIGEKAFYDCRSLADVTFASGSQLEEIGYIAFGMCESITSFDLPASVKTIGNSAFDSCVNLADFNIPENSALVSIGENAFVICPSLKSSLKFPDSLVSIGDSAFSQCKYLASISFSPFSSLKSIGARAFEYCPIAAVNIPASTEYIGNFAFMACHSLSSVTIPANGSLKYIGDHAFEGAPITAVVIPATIETIGKNAFFGCTSLADVTFHEGVSLKTIGEFAFAQTAVKALVLPSSVDTIDKNAFYSCEKLASVGFFGMPSLRIIADDAFAYCLVMDNFAIPASVESIGVNAFYACDALPEAIIPAAVTSIPDTAFAHCKALKKVYIPSTVTSIAETAFEECRNLTIHGVPGSYAEMWANSHNIPFVAQ